MCFLFTQLSHSVNSRHPLPELDRTVTTSPSHKPVSVVVGQPPVEAIPQQLHPQPHHPSPSLPVLPTEASFPPPTFTRLDSDDQLNDFSEDEDDEQNQFDEGPGGYGGSGDSGYGKPLHNQASTEKDFAPVDLEAHPDTFSPEKLQAESDSEHTSSYGKLGVSQTPDVPSTQPEALFDTHSQFSLLQPLTPGFDSEENYPDEQSLNRFDDTSDTEEVPENKSTYPYEPALSQQSPTPHSSLPIEGHQSQLPSDSPPPNPLTAELPPAESAPPSPYVPPQMQNPPPLSHPPTSLPVHSTGSPLRARLDQGPPMSLKSAAEMAGMQSAEGATTGELYPTEVIVHPHDHGHIISSVAR